MSATPPPEVVYEYPIQVVSLTPPPLSSLEAPLLSSLRSNFSSASVSISTPPDLRDAPFHLAAPGLSGRPRVADVGGLLFLAPGPDFTRKYDLRSVARIMEMPFPSSGGGGVLFGAGAGLFHVLGVNSELMPNMAWGDTVAPSAAATTSSDLHDGQSNNNNNNQTRYAKVDDRGGILCEKVPPTTTEFAFMCNLFGSEGLSGPILHVAAKSRTGRLNFTEAIQRGLEDAIAVRGGGGHGGGEEEEEERVRLISVGGVFVIKRGKVKVHVMPDFPKGGFDAREDVGDWLRFFDLDMGSGDRNEDGEVLTCLSVLYAGDGGDHLGLRMEHTHSFGGEGKGCHYHRDLDETKGEVEYEGWFNVAETLYRIDQPGVQ